MILEVTTISSFYNPFLSTSGWLYIQSHTSWCVCIYICIYVFVFMCVYIYMYVYIYICGFNPFYGN